MNFLVSLSRADVAPADVSFIDAVLAGSAAPTEVTPAAQLTQQQRADADRVLASSGLQAPAFQAEPSRDGEPIRLAQLTDVQAKQPVWGVIYGVGVLHPGHPGKYVGVVHVQSVWVDGKTRWYAFGADDPPRVYDITAAVERNGGDFRATASHLDYTNKLTLFDPGSYGLPNVRDDWVRQNVAPVFTGAIEAQRQNVNSVSRALTGVAVVGEPITQTPSGGVTPRGLVSYLEREVLPRYGLRSVEQLLSSSTYYMDHALLDHLERATAAGQSVPRWSFADLLADKSLWGGRDLLAVLHDRQAQFAADREIQTTVRAQIGPLEQALAAYDANPTTAHRNALNDALAQARTNLKSIEEYLTPAQRLALTNAQQKLAGKPSLEDIRIPRSALRVDMSKIDQALDRQAKDERALLDRMSDVYTQALAQARARWNGDPLQIFIKDPKLGFALQRQVFEAQGRLIREYINAHPNARSDPFARQTLDRAFKLQVETWQRELNKPYAPALMGWLNGAWQSANDLTGVTIAKGLADLIVDPKARQLALRRLQQTFEGMSEFGQRIRRGDWDGATNVLLDASQRTALAFDPATPEGQSALLRTFLTIGVGVSALEGKPPPGPPREPPVAPSTPPQSPTPPGKMLRLPEGAANNIAPFARRALGVTGREPPGRSSMVPVRDVAIPQGKPMGHVTANAPATLPKPVNLSATAPPPSPKATAPNQNRVPTSPRLQPGTSAAAPTPPSVAFPGGNLPRPTASSGGTDRASDDEIRRELGERDVSARPGSIGEDLLNRFKELGWSAEEIRRYLAQHPNATAYELLRGLDNAQGAGSGNGGGTLRPGVVASPGDEGDPLLRELANAQRPILLYTRGADGSIAPLSELPQLDVGSEYVCSVQLGPDGSALRVFVQPGPNATLNGASAPGRITDDPLVEMTRLSVQVRPANLPAHTQTTLVIARFTVDEKGIVKATRLGGYAGLWSMDESWGQPIADATGRPVADATAQYASFFPRSWERALAQTGYVQRLMRLESVDPGPFGVPLNSTHAERENNLTYSVLIGLADRIGVDDVLPTLEALANRHNAPNALATHQAIERFVRAVFYAIPNEPKDLAYQRIQQGAALTQNEFRMLAVTLNNLMRDRMSPALLRSRMMGEMGEEGFLDTERSLLQKLSRAFPGVATYDEALFLYRRFVVDELIR